MKKIYFIRHGLSEMNKAGLRSGSINSPLTEEGREAAKQAAAEIKPLHIDTIVSSTMDRAAETAMIIAQGIGYPPEKVLLSELLRERDFGELEGKPYVPDNDFDSVKGIETTDELFARIQQAIDWIRTEVPGENVLVVSHGAAGRALRHLLDPSVPFTDYHFPNTAVALFEDRQSVQPN